MHFVQRRTCFATSPIMILTFWRFGANAFAVFGARFFHRPPATPLWCVCERPINIPFPQWKQTFFIRFKNLWYHRHWTITTTHLRTTTIVRSISTIAHKTTTRPMASMTIVATELAIKHNHLKGWPMSTTTMATGSATLLQAQNHENVWIWTRQNGARSDW